MTETYQSQAPAEVLTTETAQTRTPSKRGISVAAPCLWIVLPAYNEEANLEPLLTCLESTLSLLRSGGYQRRYVIVDDGSTDATPEILRRFQQSLPLALLTHDPNQGLGATIRDGLALAARKARPDDVVITMDADNTHPAGLMVQMVRKVGEGNDVVIASRFRPGARVVGLCWHRKVLSAAARVLFRLVHPIRGVRDYTCGFRAYRASILQRGFEVYGREFIEYEGFHAMADVLLRLGKLGAIMSEVPMILRYDRKAGLSKMRVGSTILRSLGMLLRRRFESAPPNASQHH
jgi:dolichol-phosphate mannosyltransferase